MTDAAIPQTRINIAFTLEAEQAAKRILDRFPIGGMLEVARVGIAFALREGLSTERATDFGTANGANYNVGSVDPVGELKVALQALRPDATGDPNRILETLMSLGALAIDSKMAAGEILTLADLLGVPEATSD